jgi:hypothetical protein
MKNRKSTLCVIIILLVIFLPISIFSTVTHFQNIEVEEENPTHEFKFDGKLYFYDENDKLLGTYTCENEMENCDYATNVYSSKYALDERNDEPEKLGIVSDRFAFLKDENGIYETNILLYDISIGKVVSEYQEVKNYNVGIDNNYYILKNENNLYGVVTLDDGISLKVPFQYDYIGLINKIDSDTGLIYSDTFAVLEDDSWYLIDINGARFTNALSNDIVTYNGEYVVIKDGSTMNLMDYSGKTILTGYNYLNFYNKYLEVIDNNMFYLATIKYNVKVSQEYSVSSIDDVKLEIDGNNINLYIKDNLEETIAIQ